MKQTVQAESEKQGSQSHTDREENRFTGETHGFVDNRAEAAAQRRLMADINASPKMAAQRKASESFHNSPRMVAQRQQSISMNSSALQLAAEFDEELLQGEFEAQPYTAQRIDDEDLKQGQFDTAQRVEEDERMQAKFKPVQRVEDEGLMQGQFTSEHPAQRAQQPAAKPNNTGLPDNLKTGIESLSGISMDPVKVHYNSSKPAQLKAHAYAQGTDIHVAPGQG